MDLDLSTINTIIISILILIFIFLAGYIYFLSNTINTIIKNSDDIKKIVANIEKIINSIKVDISNNKNDIYNLNLLKNNYILKDGIASFANGKVKIDTSGNLTVSGLIKNSSGPEQRQTWYITGAPPNGVGNGTTPENKIIGASTNVGEGKYFSSVQVFGNANVNSWNTISGIFTAPTNGTYFFQFNIFNNGGNQQGRTIRFTTSSFMGDQYSFFNIQANDIGNSYNWTALIYLPANGTAYFFNQSSTNLVLYYAPAHTNLTITKI